MSTADQKLIAALHEITSSGKFATSGILPFRLHDIQIKGFGELAYPMTSIQVKALIALAHKAPFGKGSKTLLDQSVRSAWEIDADQVIFGNSKNWDDWMQKSILAPLKKDLGLPNADVEPILHKMLIYEEGDFFTWHKDSEKEKNMFGSLVLTLPSRFQGSALAVRFGGEETVFDLASASAEGNFTYTAFFADCDHEVRKLEKGHRVSLVFNLLQKKTNAPLNAGVLKSKAVDFGLKLKEWSQTMEGDYKIVLLGHQYTPENFSLEHLKLNDKPRVQVLLDAAESAGLCCKLGLYTHYQQGELEMKSQSKGRSKRYYEEEDDDYDNDDDESNDYLTENGRMGDDIYDEETYIEHWAKDESPNPGYLKVTDDNILNPLHISDDLKPIEKAAEGNMGNYGMTMEYWYHYGALVFWKKDNEPNMFAKFQPDTIEEWISYYLPKAKQKDVEAQKYIVSLLKAMQKTTSGNASTNIIDSLVFLKDKQLLSDSLDILCATFHKPSTESLLQLFKAFPPHCFTLLVNKIGEQRELHKMNKLIAVLGQAAGSPEHAEIANFHLKSLPPHLSDIGKRLTPVRVYQDEHSSIESETFNSILKLAQYADQSWNERMFKALTTNTERLYLRLVVSNGLLALKHLRPTQLFGAILNWTIELFTAHTDQEPQPRPDWSRPMPHRQGRHVAQWKILEKFMASPTEHEFFFREVQQHRTALEDAIKSQVVDLRFETLRRGSPHTLYIVKTDAEYKLMHLYWEEDLKLLAELKSL